MITSFELVLGFVILMLGMSQVLDAAIASSKIPEHKARFRSTANKLKSATTLELIHASQIAINNLFERIYGKKHYSLKCFKFSCVSSILAISIVSIVFPSAALQAEQLGLFIVFALIIFNLFVDYLSLIETRYVLSRNISRKRDAAWYAFFDIFISAFIFGFTYRISTFVALLYLDGDIHNRNYSDLLDDIMVGSGASFVWIVLFLSTFFTSVLFYMFLLSSLIIRIFKTPAINIISRVAESDNPFKLIGATLGLLSAMLAWWGSSVSS